MNGQPIAKPDPNRNHRTNSIFADEQPIAMVQPAEFMQYDAAGDVTFDGLNSYAFDTEGRVCAVGNGSSFTGYLYDGGGQRVAKGTINGLNCNLSNNGFSLTASYIHGAKGELLTEMGPGGAWVYSDVYADGKLVATYHDSNTYFALNDWLGTKRAEVSAAGCFETFSSLPYGDNLTPLGNCPDASEQHFTGKERDTESGLDYFGARYYASNMGRFTIPDWSAKEEPVPYAKLGDPQTLNLYGYMRNNPLGGVDADGHYGPGTEAVLKMTGTAEVIAPEASEIILPVAADALVGTAIYENWDSIKGAVTSVDWSNFNYSGFDPIPMSRPTSNNAPAPAPSAPSNSATPSGPNGPYKRPNNATTKEQRDGQPCATCGATGQKNNADHKDPLVEQHYRGGIDKDKMKSPDAVRPQCQSCSNQQGGYLSGFANAMKKLFGF